MFRRGLCLALALQVASLHLPVHALCADLARRDTESARPTLAACPCNPSAAKCECCCNSEKSEQSSGPALGRCPCRAEHGMVPILDSFLAAPTASTLFTDPPPGTVVEYTPVFASISAEIDPPPPR